MRKRLMYFKRKTRVYIYKKSAHRAGFRSKYWPKRIRRLELRRSESGVQNWGFKNWGVKNWKFAHNKYRKTSKNQDSVINDIWDSKHIKNLTEKIIVVDGVETNSKHFEGIRESALALATDGISIFRSQTKSCWPLFLIDYLLPPEVRTKRISLLMSLLFLDPWNKSKYSTLF